MNRDLNIRILTLTMMEKNIGERCVQELSGRNSNSTGNNHELPNYESKILHNIRVTREKRYPYRMREQL